VTKGGGIVAGKVFRLYEVRTMVTQVKSGIKERIDSKTIGKSLLEDEKTAEDNQNISFQSLANATIKILGHAFWLANEKKTHYAEYKKQLAKYGWKGEEKRYLKIAKVFEKFSPQDLAQIEPATIFLLANESKRYQAIFEQLLDLPEITQNRLRELIKEQQKTKQPKPEKPSIWRRTSNGRRYCQIPPIHEEDERTGVALQKMMDEEGLTAQQIVAEAIALRQTLKQTAAS
jgi:hypothetical protein